MRATAFLAGWRLGPAIGDRWEARWRLDDERLFAGHYPGAPLLPGSFLVEALVQAAGAALGDHLQLAELVAARFFSPVHPGDEVVASLTMTERRADRVRMQVTASTHTKTAEVTLELGQAPLAPRPQAAPATHGLAAEGSGARHLDRAFVERALPHRAPALLVEDAQVIAPSRLIAHATATSSWALGAASYPEILVVESFCQSCGLLRAASASPPESHDAAKVPVVAKLTGLRFLGPVALGAPFEHHVQLVIRTDQGAVFSGRTRAAGQVVLEVGRVVAAMAPAR
jgi:3-hydroxymyristoyl/3-hydroxydecanoyl-(acyl carrier protein) dehydratase